MRLDMRVELRSALLIDGAGMSWCHRKGRRAAALALAIALAILPAGSAMAQYLGGNGIHIDVAVQENASDGRMSIHGFDFDVLAEQAIIVDKRAFVRGVEISGNLLLAQDPGFVARLSPTELASAGLVAPAGGEQLLFNVLSPPASTMPDFGGRTISFWDGSLPVSWGPVPDDEGIRVINGSFFNPTDELVIPGGGDSDLDGFAVSTSLGSGSIHHHIKWLLLPDNGALPPLGPDDGVYMVLYEFSMPYYSEWVPVFLGIEAFAGGTTARDAALTSIENNFQLPLCSDGIDNDKDGLVDFPEDAGCADADDMSERGAVSECDDGIDNDGDGNVDFHDLDGDGASDYNGDSSCLHPDGLYEVVPEPGFATGLLFGLVGLASASCRDRTRRSAC